MANNTFIQIKRSNTVNNPTSLYQGELAWSNSSQLLFVGNPDGSNTVTPIGGKLNWGTLGANSILVTNSTSFINRVNAANLQVNFIEANGAGNVGTAGYILFSGGTGSNAYWASTGGLTTNVAAQYTWTNTQTFTNTITFNGQVNFANAISANGGVGTAGYVLISGGTGSNAYWAAPGTLSINTAAQFTWTNTQTFTNTITFNSSILANTVNAVTYTAGVYGSATSGFIANSTEIAVGNSTVNGTIIANATVVYFTGTAYNANNATNLGGTAAASYQLNSTLGANIASYLPTYTGTVNASVITDGSYGTAANGFIANSTALAWGNSTANVYIGWDSTGLDLLSIGGNINNYIEAAIWNSNTGTSVSADFSINDNLGLYSNNYIDIGINGTNWSNTQWTINGPSDGYIYTGNTNLAVGTGGNQGNLVFFTAGTLAGNERMRITTSGNVGINNTAPVDKLSVNGTTYLGGALTVTGNASMQNVNVSGNLVVSGTVVTVNTSTLQVNDNVIEIGFNNGTLSTDAIDAGIYTPSNTASTLQYSGIARIAASSATTLPWYKIFSTTTNPNSGLTITSSTTGILQAYLYPYGLGGAFVANSSAVNITANGSVSSTLTVNSATLTTALAATSGGTGQNTYTTGDILYASSSSALSKLSVTSNGQVLQIVNNLPAYNSLDGGTF